MHIKPFSLLVILFAAAAANAQPVPDSTIAKIDTIFKQWNNANTPGCAVGVIRNDSLIFAKGYGLANVEYNIPNTPQTPYHMASISKQFTAYSIVLLARQGKLKLDDDVHKYLPWFKVAQPITVRQLLNHTSGVRDQWQLLAISGTRIDDIITQEHIVKMLSKQRALNFKPGDEYMYSNSGFTMLSEIVKAVSGKTLRQFTDSAIFKPLGMSNTHFHDDCSEVVKNRSYSYWQDDSKQFKNAVLSYSVSGATSLFTTIDDMAKWVMNFYSPKAGDAADIAQLTERGKLNNGREISYALGIVNDKYKGWQRFTHDGGDAGYRTSLITLPGLKMGFLVFCNLADMNANGLANKVANLFVADSASQQVAKEGGATGDDEAAAVLKDTMSVKKYVGTYMADEGLKLRLQLQGAKLYLYTNSDTDVLVKQADGTFGIAGAPGFKIIFGKGAQGSNMAVVTPDKTFNLYQYNADSISPEMLRTYVGKYYCPELDCSYGIALKNGKLFLTNSKYDDSPIRLTGAGHLYCDNWWMSHLQIKRSPAGKITGFEVNDGRIMHLAFNKVE